MFFLSLDKTTDPTADFKKILKQEVNGGKAVITPEAYKLIETFMNNGIDKLKETKASTADVERAKKNFRDFVKKMIASGADSKAGKVINQETFNATKSSVCPIYPFC